MNAWLESGRSDTFAGVRPHDVVFRSSSGTNSLVLGNGLDAAAHAALYVASNCIGIHRLPSASATIALDIGGEVACRSNMVWCDAGTPSGDVLSGCNATKVSASGLVLNDGTRDTVSIDRTGAISCHGSVQASRATFGDPGQPATQDAEVITVLGRAGFERGVCLLVGGDGTTGARASASLSFDRTSGMLSVGTHATLGPDGLSVNGGIASSGHMFAPAYKVLSDCRMKSDIVASGRDTDLGEILSLAVKRYVLVDNGSDRDTGVQVGVLAHELARVLPDAVSRVADYVPDIMESATFVKHEPGVGSWLACKAASRMAVGETLRLKIGNHVASAEVTCVDVRMNRVRLLCVAHGRAALEALCPGDMIFIYGRLRHDIMAVDTSQILFRLVSAVQGLHARLEAMVPATASEARLRPIVGALDPFLRSAGET